MFWGIPLFTAPDTSDLIVGVVVIEIATFIPAGYVAVRSHQLTKLVEQADRATQAEQKAAAEVAQRQSERLWHLNRVTESLARGPAKEAALEAVRALEQNLPLHAALVQREMQLKDLVSLTTDALVIESLNSSLASCAEQLSRLDHELDHLVSAVANVVDAATEGQTAIAVQPLREATERVGVLAETLRQLTLMYPTKPSISVPAIDAKREALSMVTSRPDSASRIRLKR